MKHALNPIIAGLLTATLACPAAAGLTEKPVKEAPLTFSWEVSWDGKAEISTLTHPELKYWIPDFSIANLDNGSMPNDLYVQLKHKDVGPEEIERKDHDLSELYRFQLNNIVVHLPELDPPRVQNINGSIQQIAHNGTGLKHRDNVRLEYKRVGQQIDFQLIAVHEDVSPVPEPLSWAMACSGLLILCLARRQARSPGLTRT